MSSRDRSDSLVKDLALLFVKYRLRDWLPLLAELRRGQHAALADAIETLTRQVPPTRRKPGKRPARKIGQGSRKSEPGLSPVLRPLYEALKDRSLLAVASDLRAIYVDLRIKQTLPPRRSAAIQLLIQHLDTLPEGQRRDAIQLILARKPVAPDSFSEDYHRWFELIRKSRNLGDPATLAKPD